MRLSYVLFVSLVALFAFAACRTSLEEPLVSDKVIENEEREEWKEPPSSRGQSGNRETSGAQDLPGEKTAGKEKRLQQGAAPVIDEPSREKKASAPEASFSRGTGQKKGESLLQEEPFKKGAFRKEKPSPGTKKETKKSGEKNLPEKNPLKAKPVKKVPSAGEAFLKKEVYPEEIPEEKAPIGEDVGDVKDPPGIKEPFRWKDKADATAPFSRSNSFKTTPREDSVPMTSPLPEAESIPIADSSPNDKKEEPFKENGERANPLVIVDGGALKKQDRRIQGPSRVIVQDGTSYPMADTLPDPRRWEESQAPEADRAVEAPVEKRAPLGKILPEQYHLSVDSGGKLSIFLEGAGWIFLSEKSGKAVRLLDKSFEPSSGRTRFVFKADNSEDFNTDFVFLRQDLMAGDSESMVLPIDEDNNPFFALKTEKTEALKTERQLLREARPASQPEDSPNREDVPVQNSPVLEESPANSISKDYERMRASDLLETAMAFERPGKGQSLEKAMSLYRLLVKIYPVTEERFIAESRIRYLNKFYFKVQ